MDPASFQPGSAPIEYQVQVPSSNSPSSLNLSHLSTSASRLGSNEVTSLKAIASSTEGQAIEQQQDTRPESNKSLIRGGPSPALRLSSPLSDGRNILDSPAASSSLDYPKATDTDTRPDSPTTIFSNATVEAIRSNSNDNDSSIDHASSAPVSAPMSCSKPNKPRSSSPLSVSRLCFPFVTSASRRKKAPPVPPPTRHKYSCTHPTLMAPYHTGKVFPVHQRHQYSHHGPSRQGIERLRAFWAGKLVQDSPESQSDSSEDQRSKAQARLAALYDMDHTVVEMPATIHPLASEESQHAQHQLPPMTVHPRRGDIMALRDPFCMQIDRQFVNLPTWTIGKAIWMQDVHIASEKRQAQLDEAENAQTMTRTASFLSSASSDGGEEQDDDSWQDEDGASTDAESEIETSISTGFSDDSDATLVESESESDLPRLGAVKAHSTFYQWASEGSSPPRRSASIANPTLLAGPSSILSPISTSSSDVNPSSLRPSPLFESSNSSISDMSTNTNIDVDIDLSSWSQTFYKSNSSSNNLPVKAHHSSRCGDEETEDDDEILSMSPPTTPTAPKRPSTPVRACTPRQSWQTNWYCRWELLVDLTRKGRNHKHSSSCSCPTTPVTEGSVKGHKFFLKSVHSDDEDDSDGLNEKRQTRSRGRTISA
ncbi:hypothetical protein BJ165DRAFT_1103732 [Panaeolus papilionaceus]|nr:hypothetical protein BJ165DRAFT_1103732 [Panaeolus papilionaceus]